MLGVWAAWALAGFGYPSAPLPIALNIASKMLAFVTAFTLFLPRRPAFLFRRPAPGPEQRAGRRVPGPEQRAGRRVPGSEERAGRRVHAVASHRLT
jgi:hypothetical protein